MNTLIRWFAFVGLFVVVFSILGALGIGDFGMYYGTNIKPWCESQVAMKEQRK
jgi:hypothetical protein